MEKRDVSNPQMNKEAQTVSPKSVNLSALQDRTYCLHCQKLIIGRRFTTL